MESAAIGDVTVGLKNLLDKGLGDDYQVTLAPPWEDFGTAAGVNLFLYRVEENSQWKNMEWPGDRSNPVKMLRPALSLDLYYVLTPYAPREKETSVDEAIMHKILGSAMQILHENPVLNDIHHAYFDADANFPEHLRNSYEKVKITLNPINLEEMSKLWSMGNTSYRLSVAYHVSLVQIAPTLPVKPFAAPVQEIGLGVTTHAPPAIARLTPSIGPAGTQIQIIGTNLSTKGCKTTIKVGDRTVTELIRVSDHEIAFSLPDNLAQGPDQRISVIVNGRDSNAALFHASPWVTSIKPLQGAVDSSDTHAVPIQITGHDFQGAVQIRIGGTDVEAADISIKNENLIKTYVPKSLANGDHDIEMTVDGDPTNKRSFEVIPRIDNLIPAQGLPEDSITLEGQRLAGKKIRLGIGPSVITQNENSNPNQIVFNIPKALNPGEYKVKATVDGHESNIALLRVVE